MATFIASLAVKLGLKSAAFNKGMDRSRQATKRFQKQTNLAAGAVAKFGAAMIGAFGARRMVSMLSQQIDLIDNLAKTSQKLGIATNKLAGLHHAAALSGVKIATFDMALQRMTRRLAEAARGTGEAKAALLELGVSAQALILMSPDKAFGKIATAMSHVQNQADKVRLSFKLFDSEGVALVNTLAMGERGLRGFAIEAKRLGLAISDDAVQGVVQLKDDLTRLQAAWEGAKNRWVMGWAEIARARERALPFTMKPQVGWEVGDFVGDATARWEQAYEKHGRYSEKIAAQQKALEDIRAETWSRSKADRKEHVRAEIARLSAEQDNLLMVVDKLGKMVDRREEFAKFMPPTEIKAVAEALDKFWDGFIAGAYKAKWANEDAVKAMRDWWKGVKGRGDAMRKEAEAAQDYWDRMKDLAKQYKREVETPEEAFKRQMLKVEQLFRSKQIDLQTYTRQVAKLGEELAGPKVAGISGGPTPALQIGTQAAYGALLKGRKNRMEELTDQLLIEAKKQTTHAANTKRHAEVIADEHLNN